MLYKLNVFYARKEPHPWDSLEGVYSLECQTQDIMPLGEAASADTLHSRLAERHHLGRIPAYDFPLKPGEEPCYVYIACDGVGLIHATGQPGETFVVSDATVWKTLHRREWQQLGELLLRVEPIVEAHGSWKAVTSGMPWRRRFLNWLLRRRCGGCLYFDRKGAHEWRTKVTHAFGGVSSGADVAMYDAMNDDITKMSASALRAPDFQPGEMGYCPRRDCGLSARLPACPEYKRS